MPNTVLWTGEPKVDDAMCSLQTLWSRWGTDPETKCGEWQMGTCAMSYRTSEQGRLSKALLGRGGHPRGVPEDGSPSIRQR